MREPKPITNLQSALCAEVLASRRHCGLSQSKVAKMLGWTQGGFHSLEAGKRRWTFESFAHALWAIERLQAPTGASRWGSMDWRERAAKTYREALDLFEPGGPQLPLFDFNPATRPGVQAGPGDPRPGS